jgi:hypothetical protein
VSRCAFAKKTTPDKLNFGFMYRVLCYISQWSYYFCRAMSSLIVWRPTSRRVCNLPFNGHICRLVWSVTAAMLPALLCLTVLFIFIRFIDSGMLVGERNFVVRNLSSCEDITFSFTDILFVISICELSDWCKV